MGKRTWAVNGDNYRNAPEHVVQRVLRARQVTPEGCWLWPFSGSAGGYGRTKYKNSEGKSAIVFVHRLIYTHLVADPGDLMQMDHLCHDPEVCLLGNNCPHRRCFNPEHLEPVTFDENNRRGRTFLAVNTAKTHCPHGHPYDEANTRWYQGQRVCRTCDRLRKRRMKAALTDP